ncbi:MAG: hypothetical protein WED00_13240 [Aquisalimonadaceae bacterium]
MNAATSRAPGGARSSDRFFRVSRHQSLRAGWYIETREGFSGPYRTRAAAEGALILLVDMNPRRRISLWQER